MRCGRSSRPLPMSAIRSIPRCGQSKPRWILPRRNSNNLSKRPKTCLPCTKSLLNKHERRCGLQAAPMLIPVLSHLFSNQRVFSCPSSPTPRGDVQDVPPSSTERSVSLCRSCFAIRAEDCACGGPRGCGRPTARECSAILIRRPRLKQWLRRMRAMGYVSGRKEELRSLGVNDSMHRRVRRALCGPFHQYW